MMDVSILLQHQSMKRNFKISQQNFALCRCYVTSCTLNFNSCSIYLHLKWSGIYFTVSNPTVWHLESKIIHCTRDHIFIQWIKITSANVLYFDLYLVHSFLTLNVLPKLVNIFDFTMRKLVQYVLKSSHLFNIWNKISYWCYEVA